MKFKDFFKKHRLSSPIKKDKVKLKTKLVNYFPWDYYVKRTLVIDEELSLETCVVVHKNGSIQQVYGFRGHDIESFSSDYIAQVFLYFNEQIKRLGDGWMVSVEAQRYLMHEYPASDFDCVTGLLVDRERANEFSGNGEHYDSCYYLNFVYKPESEIKKKVTKLFFKEEEKNIIIKDEINDFVKKVEQITSVLSSRMIIRPLDCHETVCYLHSTCSTKRHEFLLPDHFLFLDSILADQSLEVGKTIRLGDKYIPIVSINDFPNEIYPTILNELNKLDVEYRWVSRFFPISKETALKELESYQRDAAGKKKSGGQMASEMLFGYEGTLQNHAGLLDQSDAEEAQGEVGGGVQGLGYYNSCVMVWDEDYDKAIRKMKEVMKVIEQQQFSCKEEEFSAFDAFLGMMAGETNHNIRRPLITTGNYAYTLPFSAVWAGIESNKFMNEVCGVDKPLVTCTTDFGANFYLNLNDGDVGHTLILGPTGAGKSTFLNLLAVSALKYTGCQVFIMDYGLSALTLTIACGGTYINPGKENICFQPLRDIDDPKEFQWAIEFIKTLILLQGVEWNAEMGTAIEAAMTAVSIMPVEMRTITTFTLNLQYVDDKGRRVLETALTPYTLKGRFGKIFDGDKTNIGKSRWILFEMEHLMDMGKDCSGPAILYIFHYLENSFNGRLTFFFMDECWFGLENEAIASKMKTYLLTLRKKNVFCIFATQNPSAVADSPLATTIIQNCPTQIFLADPKAKKLLKDYQKLGLSEEEVTLLSYCTKKRDYYFKSSLGTRKFQLALGKISLALFRGYESKIKLKDGSIVEWKKVLDFIIQKREECGYQREMFDKILDIQQVPYNEYLLDIDLEKIL